MYSNINDSHSFWHCVYGQAYLKPCPQSFIWSQERRKCEKKLPTSTTSLPATSTSTSTSTTTFMTTTTTTVPIVNCPRLITFDNIPGAGRSQQPLPNGFSGFQWVNANYMNVSYYEEVNGWSGYSAALSSGQYVGLNKDGKMLSMIINAAKSFTLKSMIVASAWNDNLTLEITGKRGGSVFKSQRFTLQLQQQSIELNWPNLEIINFLSYGGEPNSDIKGNGPEFALDNLCVEFPK
ncbi:unnamed protein product [Rotaria socialis]|uniref:Chitin-binding type-2 domain-containing protein n=1 Tax=Rotaria socialis TaxID=392032 RepID=A0A817VHB1_9BILA|nr:unnamed protein product [Rotaria socialis]